MVSEPDIEDMSARRLSYEGGGHETAASKDVGPQREVDWRVPHRSEKGTRVNEDVWSQEGGLRDPTSVGEENETFRCGNLPLAHVF